eukprot:338092-Prorocentrum_minimum.AAC.1
MWKRHRGVVERCGGGSEGKGYGGRPEGVRRHRGRGGLLLGGPGRVVRVHTEGRQWELVTAHFWPFWDLCGHWIGVTAGRWG